MNEKQPERREQRHSDIVLAELNTRFEDFVERYERDVVSARIAMVEQTKLLTSHDEFIREIKPMYSKGMIALGAFTVGSIGIATAWLWGHLKWG